MRSALLPAALAALCVSAQAGEIPEAAAAAMKARDYAAALKAAEGKAGAEALADIRALAAAKAKVIERAKARRKPSVTVEVMGQRMRSRVTAADQKSYSLLILGAERSFGWAITSDERFLRLAKACIDRRSGADQLMLARAAVALGQTEQAESALTEAVRRDFKLRAEAATLRSRLPSAPAGRADAAGPRATAGPPAPGRPGNAVTVGFESGAEACRMTAADRGRLASLPLQDLVGRMEGRYTHVKDDGAMGHWGLDAVMARADAQTKPYAELKSGGHYQTERVVFADLSTGATMMRLTDEPYGPSGDEILYFGKAGFTADGSKMVWQRSAKISLWGPGSQTTSETHGIMVRDGDGSRPRIAFGERPSVRIPICHPTDPGLAYAYSGRDVVELDMKSEKFKRVVASGLPMWWLKLSPDGQYVCSAPYGRGKIAVVRIEDGKRWDIPLRRNIHDSYRFVPGNTDTVMLWYEGGALRSEGFHIYNFKTGEDRLCKTYFDWNHGDVGRHFGYHVSCRMLYFDGKTFGPMVGLNWPEKRWNDTGPWYDNPVSANGYAQHWPDDELWAYGTRIVERPWLSDVHAVFAKPFPEGGRVNRFRVCCTNLRRRTDRKGQKAQVLDRPNVSYDGTKMLFNSNVFGRAEVYMAVIRKPRPPVGVKAAGNRITWEHPKYHQEIAGYRVYRSSESGRGFMPVPGGLVRGTEYTAPGSGFYAVRSVEHSRIESGLSAEAAVGAGDGPRRIFVEAESGLRAGLGASPPDGIWRNIDGLASDLHYVWQRRKDKAGRLEIEVEAPRAGSYTVFARVKGASGAQWQIGSAAVSAPASPAWQWVKGGATALKAGKNTVAVAASKYGSCLDCFCLATDAGFKPEGRILAVRPAKLALSAGRSGSGKPRLTWSGAKDGRWYHYNLYCGGAKDFKCDRAGLVASPDAESHLDWSAPAGGKFYRVTQVTLDGLESEPSEAVAVE